MSDLIEIDTGHDVPVYPEQCSVCLHYLRGEGHACAAFPAGIPEDILRGKFDHLKPHDGDSGIRFEAWAKKKAAR